MIQVWLIDNQGFYTNESKLVYEVGDNMTTVPLLVGYIKPQLVDGVWQEGATEEEIKAWQEANRPPVAEETQEQKMARLEEHMSLLQDVVFSALL